VEVEYLEAATLGLVLLSKLSTGLVGVLSAVSNDNILVNVTT
jgi:hypothetical protein